MSCRWFHRMHGSISTSILSKIQALADSISSVTTLSDLLIAIFLHIYQAKFSQEQTVVEQNTQCTGFVKSFQWGDSHTRIFKIGENDLAYISLKCSYFSGEILCEEVEQLTWIALNIFMFLFFEVRSCCIYREIQLLFLLIRPEVLLPNTSCLPASYTWNCRSHNVS